MRFQGVLFASDFDSALASSDERLRPAVLRAIDRFIQNGGYFTLATGRHPPALKGLDPRCFNAPPPSWATTACSMIFSISRPVELHGTDQCVCIRPIPSPCATLPRSGFPFAFLENPECIPFPLAKIMLSGAGEQNRPSPALSERPRNPAAFSAHRRLLSGTSGFGG